MVKPVVLYGSEVWGLARNFNPSRIDNEFGLEKHLLNYYKSEDLQLIQCRQILGVPKKCTNMEYMVKQVPTHCILI